MKQCWQKWCKPVWSASAPAGTREGQMYQAVSDLVSQGWHRAAKLRVALTVMHRREAVIRLLLRCPGPLHFRSRVSDACVNFQGQEGVTKADLPMHRGAWCAGKCSAQLLADLPSVCRTTRAAPRRWKGSLFWRLQGRKEGRTSVEVSFHNSWTCLAAEHTKPACDTSSCGASTRLAVPAAREGTCLGAQAVLIYWVSPLTLLTIFKRMDLECLRTVFV